VRRLYQGWDQRHLVMALGKRDVLQRFRASRLGPLWLVLQPLATIATFYFVFVIVFKARWRIEEDAGGEYILALFAGLIGYNAFIDIVARAPHLVTGNVNYVKKIVFPLDLLPCVAALSAFVTFVVASCIWLVAFVLIRGTLPAATTLAAPILLLPIFLYALAAAWVLSALCVYFRDVAQAVPLALQALIFLSPVLYPLERVPSGPFRVLLLANPLTIPIEGFRNLALYGRLPSAPEFMISLSVALAAAAAGHHFFQRARAGFADVL
jgi:lipopolysaccharide transport system permease protein